MARPFDIGMFTFQMSVIDPRGDDIPTTQLTAELSKAVAQACDNVGLDQKRVKIEVIDG